MRGLRVVSLFDGSVCGMEALVRCGFKIDHYWASEIDKYAMTVALNNYPFIEHIGDVTKVNGWTIDAVVEFFKHIPADNVLLLQAVAD